MLYHRRARRGHRERRGRRHVEARQPAAAGACQVDPEPAHPRREPAWPAPVWRARTQSLRRRPPPSPPAPCSSATTCSSSVAAPANTASAHARASPAVNSFARSDGGRVLRNLRTHGPILRRCPGAPPRRKRPAGPPATPPPCRVDANAGSGNGSKREFLTRSILRRPARAVCTLVIERLYAPSGDRFDFATAGPPASG